MGKSLKTVSFVICFLKIFGAIFAFAYLLMWFIQFFDLEAFENFNRSFGAIPNWIDKKIDVRIDSFGHEATAGSVYFAGCLALFCVLMNDVERKFRIYAKKVENEEIERALNRMLEKRKKEKQIKIRAQRRCAVYFALLEFEFINLGMNENFSSKVSKLKKEYAKMLVNKIIDKYPTIKFLKSDKILIKSADFSQLFSLVCDCEYIFKFFNELNKKKAIETNLLFSFYCDYENKSFPYVLRILKKINLLNNKNKIMFDGKILENIPLETKKQLQFVPFGPIMLENVDKSGKDLNVEIFYKNII